MRQLTGLDASFLAMELTNSPMHVGSLAIYDPSTAPKGKVRFKQVLKQVELRAAQVPSMKEVLKHVPMNIDHPYWVTDTEFDPEFHIRHVALPKPGDWRQLCIQVSRIHARQLDRSRPLWEIYIIEGLDNLEGFPKGCFAMLSKIHHATIDGASGGELAAALHDFSADPDAEEPEYVGADKSTRHPSNAELLMRAQLNNLRYPLKYLGVVRGAVPRVARTLSGLAKGDLRRIKKTPRTRFNGKVSPHRVFDSVRLKMADILEIKNSFPGVTVNDVALCIVGGALRSYLISKDELPEISMVAAAPVNLRTESKTEPIGNQVSNMTVRLCTDIEDPVDRLNAIHEGTQDAKAYSQSMGARSMTDIVELIPSAIAGPTARISGRLGMTDRMSPMYNCSVTNVPGPRVPLYFQGAKMLINYGMGPVMDGVGIFNIINSYCEEFSLSFTSCREMIPDPAFYAECIQNSFDELHEAIK